MLNFEIADCVSVTRARGKVKHIPLGRSNGRDCRRAVHCGSPRRRRDGRTQSERERRAEGAADGNIGCVARPRGRRGRFRRVASRLVLNVVARILTRSSLALHLLLDPGNVEMPNVNKFPSSKLKLDEFFLNWLSSQDSQKLVRPRPPGSRGPSVFAHPPAAVARARPRPVSSIHRNAAVPSRTRVLP